MAERDPKLVQLYGNILCRDQDGNEHLLGVTDLPAGMVRIADDQMVRIMSPRAVVALVVALIHAAGSDLSVRSGDGVS